jgi:hypothetical protein
MHITNQRRLGVLLVKIDQWEDVGDDIAQVTQRLLREIADCLTDILLDERKDPYERPQK